MALVAAHLLRERPEPTGRARAPCSFPDDPLPARWIKERIARRVVAKRFGSEPAAPRDGRRPRRGGSRRSRNARLGGRRWLTGDADDRADVALATMSAPLAADPECRADREVVRALLAWGRRSCPADVRRRVYRG